MHRYEWIKYLSVRPSTKLLVKALLQQFFFRICVPVHPTPSSIGFIPHQSLWVRVEPFALPSECAFSTQPPFANLWSWENWHDQTEENTCIHNACRARACMISFHADRCCCLFSKISHGISFGSSPYRFRWLGSTFKAKEHLIWSYPAKLIESGSSNPSLGMSSWFPSSCSTSSGWCLSIPATSAHRMLMHAPTQKSAAFKKKAGQS